MYCLKVIRVFSKMYEHEDSDKILSISSDEYQINKAILSKCNQN